MRLNIILYVSDQARSAAFYGAVLGFYPRLNVPGMTEFGISGECVLGLMPEKGVKKMLPAMPDPAGGGGIPRAELYLSVDSPAEYHARALAAGARELAPLAARDWGDEAVYSLDPDGHVLAFARRLPLAG